MRARTGCQSCRDRHIKCVRRGGDKDTCEKCLENRRECFNTAALKFKPVRSVVLKTKDGHKSKQDLTHDARQVWVDVPFIIDFVANGEEAEPRLDHAQEKPIDGGPLYHDGSKEHLGTLHDSASNRKDTEEWIAAPLVMSDGPLVDDHEHTGKQDHLTGQTSYHGSCTSLLRARTVSKGSPSSNRPRIIQHQHQFSQDGSLHSSPHLQGSESNRIMNHTSPNVFIESPSSSMRHAHMASTPSNLNSPAFSLSPSWPFVSPREARLFYHYLKRISPWIDVLDGPSFFRKEICRRISYHPLISNAIFALSSLHISLLEGTEDLESPGYMDESLQYLKQLLEDPLSTADESLLAGVILLRSHEEMGEYDQKGHLLGATRVLNSIASHAADGGFKEAASWISLRQHIYISLTSQSPLTLNLSNYQHSSVFVDQSDESYANRIVFIFACVLNYVFGSEEHDQQRSLDAERWAELDAEVEAWNVTKPWFFTPLWIESSKERSGPWPEALTSHPAHAIGLQHYALCKIVLSIYDPRLAKLGFASHKLRKSSEVTVVENLRMAIGLAVSNPDVTNAMFQASHILAVCGSYLHDSTDQEAAVSFLRGMQKSMGWRTGHIINTLKEQWAG